MSNRPFKSVRAPQPGRSFFDLSYSKLLDCDMGQLIPIACDEVLPGDRWKIGNEMVVRMQPLVSPVLHEINVFTHYFFVPYRILWTGWENFITGGEDGDDVSTPPRWVVTTQNTKHSLWDYFGFPVGIHPSGAYPLDFPRRAYNLIWNEFYRDQNFQDKIDITDVTKGGLLRRSWQKDYFTSALPWQQRGTAPALPISGQVSAIYDTDFDQWAANHFNQYNNNTVFAHFDSEGTQSEFVGDGRSLPIGNYDIEAKVHISKEFLSDNLVDLESATTFNVADLRLAFQMQKHLERNARAGSRYTEVLRGHWSVAPRDDRLQRPEYIGGSMAPLIISEVLQTSQTSTGTDASPQGHMAGHGLAVNQTFCGKFFAQEYGLVIGIMSIMPVPMYQQGINRQWQRRNKFDFPWPEFVGLSEQAIETSEIYASDDTNTNVSIFGYTGRYNECRYKPNMVVGDMRDDFAFWHLGRVFDNAPSLNTDFITCNPDKRIFAVENESGFIVHFGNSFKVSRFLPAEAEPGLIDHF